MSRDSQPMTLATVPAAAAGARPLNFVRHGATPPNLARLRCGGDLDVAMTDLGRQQARDAARRIVESGLQVGLIVSSGLLRTDESARLIAEGLGGVPVITVPGLIERRLGEWNLRPLAETEASLLGDAAPPGGESNADFIARIGDAVQALLPQRQRGLLVVGSSGVARALGVLTGRADTTRVRNGQVLQFDLSTLRLPQTAGDPA
jgi:2,3-bisphosphoglycerate-dependent phosphoglycerate mutase